MTEKHKVPASPVGPKAEVKLLTDALQQIGYKTLLYRDMLETSAQALAKGGDIDKLGFEKMVLQIRTIDAVLRGCIGVDQEAVDNLRRHRDATPALRDEFNRMVENTCKNIAPRKLIIPGDRGWSN